MVEIKYHVRETLTKIARKQNDLTALTTDGVSTTRPPIGGVTPALVITYNDNMAHINGALRQIWGEVVNNDPLLHMLYPNIPLVAVKRNENIAEYVSKAVVQYEPRLMESPNFDLRKHIALGDDYTKDNFI